MPSLVGSEMCIRDRESVLLEDKLPAEGYVLSGEKRENVVINLPIKDRSLLAELVRKFGWACM